MVTTQRSSNWETLTTVQKGNIGEKLVQRFLESKGFICYKPVSDGAHPFDFLCVKEKRLAIAAEVKTKSLMSKYKATGFDQRSYEDYKAFAETHNMMIFIFFVDEHERKIYGNWLHVLEQKRVEWLKSGEKVIYPLVIPGKKPVRVYPYSAMKVITDIPTDICDKLKSLSQRNYEYRAS